MIRRLVTYWNEVAENENSATTTSNTIIIIYYAENATSFSMAENVVSEQSFQIVPAATTPLLEMLLIRHNVYKRISSATIITPSPYKVTLLYR